MTTYPYLVKVPKTESSAYNEDRPISSLIRGQLKHLHEVEKTLPAHHQTKIDITHLKTERKASEYIGRLMSKLVKATAEKSPTRAGTTAAGRTTPGTRTKKTAHAKTVSKKRVTATGRNRASAKSRKPRRQR